MKKSDKISQAQTILRALGLPPPQQNQISALTLLALCGIGTNDSWLQARRDRRTVTKGIMDFIREKYRVPY
ncbi:MAG: BsuBI/PstI family type II restriction endonuclease, partial [Candidatus Binatus sp.]